MVKAFCRKAQVSQRVVPVFFFKIYNNCQRAFEEKNGEIDYYGRYILKTREVVGIYIYIYIYIMSFIHAKKKKKRSKTIHAPNQQGMSGLGCYSPRERKL